MTLPDGQERDLLWNKLNLEASLVRNNFEYTRTRNIW